MLQTAFLLNEEEISIYTVPINNNYNIYDKNSTNREQKLGAIRVVPPKQYDQLFPCASVSFEIKLHNLDSQ